MDIAEKKQLIKQLEDFYVRLVIEAINGVSPIKGEKISEAFQTLKEMLTDARFYTLRLYEIVHNPEIGRHYSRWHPIKRFSARIATEEANQALESLSEELLLKASESAKRALQMNPKGTFREFNSGTMGLESVTIKLEELGGIGSAIQAYQKMSKIYPIELRRP